MLQYESNGKIFLQMQHGAKSILKKWNKEFFHFRLERELFDRTIMNTLYNFYNLINNIIYNFRYFDNRCMIEICIAKQKILI